MAILFWFLFYVCAISGAFFTTYVIAKSEGAELQDAKLYAFAVALVVMCIWSGFTACAFANKML